MSTDDLRQLILAAPVFLLAISFHEFAHAWAAVRLGDLTPLYEGRLTLNFTRHLSLWGTVMFLVASIGWAKPVRVNMRNLKDPVRDLMLISVAGPLANFTLAVAFALLYKVAAPLVAPTPAAGPVVQLLSIGVWLNLLLGIFNLVPIPPLDGAKILSPFLPPRLRYGLSSLEPWGFILIYLLFVVGGLGRALLLAVLRVYAWLM